MVSKAGYPSAGHEYATSLDLRCILAPEEVINDKGYDERWDSKYKWYIENDILPFEQGGGDNGTLIVTKDKPKTIEDGSTRGAISILEIDKIISDVFGR